MGNSIRDFLLAVIAFLVVLGPLVLIASFNPRIRPLYSATLDWRDSP